MCKLSQQLDHISHGKLIFFYFFDIFIIFFLEFETQYLVVARVFTPRYYYGMSPRGTVETD